jgi:hypothetical protein
MFINSVLIEQETHYRSFAKKIINADLRRQISISILEPCEQVSKIQSIHIIKVG